MATTTVGCGSRDHDAQTILRTPMARARMWIDQTTLSRSSNTVMILLILLSPPKTITLVELTYVVTEVSKAVVLLVSVLGRTTWERFARPTHFRIITDSYNIIYSPEFSRRTIHSRVFLRLNRDL